MLARLVVTHRTFSSNYDRLPHAKLVPFSSVAERNEFEAYDKVRTPVRPGSTVGQLPI